MLRRDLGHISNINKVTLLKLTTCWIEYSPKTFPSSPDINTLVFTLQSVSGAVFVAITVPAELM